MDDERVYRKEKKPSIVGTVLRWTLYGIMIFVLSVLFLRLFSTGEPGSAKKLYLDARTEQIKNELKKEFSLYQLSVVDFITSDGLYHISRVYYLDSADRLQLTVRNKLKNLSDPKSAEPLVYELSDQDGNISRGVYANTEFRFNYRFDTIVFDNVYIDTEKAIAYAAGGDAGEDAGEKSVILEIFFADPREALGHMTVFNKYVALNPKNIMGIKTVIK